MAFDISMAAAFDRTVQMRVDRQAGIRRSALFLRPVSALFQELAGLGQKFFHFFPENLRPRGFRKMEPGSGPGWSGG